MEDLTARDVKIAYLKNLQGYLWKDGYKSGAYATNLFEDVVPQLRQWKDKGYSLAIYSSGSVYAQKLLFGHVQTESATATKKRSRDEDEDAESGAVEQPPSKKPAQASVGSPAEEASETLVPHASNGSTPAKDAEDSADGAAASKHSTEQNGLQEEPLTEDLTHLFDGWFDTTNAGLKTESSSYTKITESLKVRIE